MLKKRNPFMESFRKWGLHAPKEAAIPSEECFLGEAVMSLVADETIRQLFIARCHSERDDIDSMSSGSMPPDLGDAWLQGLPTNPQWEGGLERNSDRNYEDENEFQDDGSYEEFDSDAESGPNDYIGEVSESSLWASIPDHFTPPDIYSWIKVE